MPIIARLAKLSAIFMIGCGTNASMVVDLRTDLRPLLEFETVDVELSSEAGSTTQSTNAENLRYENGVRVAEFRDLRPGTYQVRVQVGASAETPPVASASVVTEVSRDTSAVTVVLTRSCAGIACSDVDRPMTCLGGRCVDARCSPEASEHCPEPECEAPADCAGGSTAACVAASCQTGVCFAVAADDLCEEEQVCDPTVGCRNDVPGVDAGVGDAGNVDAGNVDAGNVDARADAGAPGEVLRVTAGFAHTCARRIGGSGELRCFGSNDTGQLGLGDGAPTLLNRPSMVVVPSGFQQIAAGHNHTCGIRGLTTFCWGENSEGQLGDGSETERNTPTEVTGLSDSAALVAYNHTCAIRGGGAVSCWGLNDAGQVGDGTTDNRSSPTVVVGLADVASLALGDHHTCARFEDGTVSCWGENSDGQLGTGDRTPSLSPVAASITDVMDLVAGEVHTCALLTSGSVRCWGDNAFGQIGDSTFEDALAPTEPLDLRDDIVQLSAGEHFTCARASTGSVVCWGTNGLGQLGSGEGPGAWGPSVVSDLTDAVWLAAGGQHACAVREAGGVVCWGNNFQGQLGNGGVVTFSRVPTVTLDL